MSVKVRDVLEYMEKNNYKRLIDIHRNDEGYKIEYPSPPQGLHVLSPDILQRFGLGKKIEKKAQKRKAAMKKQEVKKAVVKQKPPDENNDVVLLHRKIQELEELAEARLEIANKWRGWATTMHNNNMGRDAIKIIAQMTGMKNLRIEGGWRLQLDLFESRERDAMLVLGLVNRRATVAVTIEPLKEDTPNG